MVVGSLPYLANTTQRDESERWSSHFWSKEETDGGGPVSFKLAGVPPVTYEAVLIALTLTAPHSSTIPFN